MCMKLIAQVEKGHSVAVRARWDALVRETASLVSRLLGIARPAGPM